MVQDRCSSSLQPPFTGTVGRRLQPLMIAVEKAWNSNKTQWGELQLKALLMVVLQSLQKGPHSNDKSLSNGSKLRNRKTARLSDCNSTTSQCFNETFSPEKIGQILDFGFVLNLLMLTKEIQSRKFDTTQVYMIWTLIW